MGVCVYDPLCVPIYTTKNLPLCERTIMCLERFQNSRMEVSHAMSFKMLRFWMQCLSKMCVKGFVKYVIRHFAASQPAPVMLT